MPATEKLRCLQKTLTYLCRAQYMYSSPSPFVRSLSPPTKPFLANYKLYVYAEACFPCSFSTVGTLPQPLRAGPPGPPGRSGIPGPPGKNGQGYDACIDHEPKQ